MHQKCAPQHRSTLFERKQHHFQTNFFKHMKVVKVVARPTFQSCKTIALCFILAFAAEPIKVFEQRFHLIQHLQSFVSMWSLTTDG